MRIILLRGQSQYDVLGIFIDQLAVAFNLCNIETHVLNILDADMESQLLQLLEKKVDFFISFNLTGLLKVNNCEWLFDALNIPLISILVDHPIHHLSRLQAGIQHLLVGVVDRGMLPFLQRFLPEIQSPFFLPHGAIECSHSLPAIPDGQQKKHQILLSGTYSSLEGITNEIQAMPTEIKNLLRDIIDHGICHEGRSLIEITEYVLSEKNILDETVLVDLSMTYLEYVDKYIRSYWRENAIDGLLSNQWNVAVCGNGWENHPKSGDLSIYSARSGLAVIELMHQAEICLDVGANFIYGAHERTLTAMLNYIPVVVHRNEFYQKNFEDQKQLMLYSHNNKEELAEKIFALLDHPEYQIEMGMAAHDAVATRHTWLRRAKSILSHFYLYQDRTRQ
ncbi:glycosyltransferase involved in cell wall biosynthesis [Sporomusaceae bacterium BoRhaA]|uniref:glycosyltransferase n=1 Tax=Pelorhabdus rhamnosifermentans TaxID=2772457 RepID=UPI001C063EC1|nr:glycosyltransferase [Pelorhabdus rhamnosifermentans]MBU2699197.1 glycosyltransferase involved in cell wall biosynthesis [Pelorhabdus rhamnosifermentans]